MATKIDVNKLNWSNVYWHVELTGVKRFTLRIRLGLLFVRLGVWITGMRFQFDGIDL